MIHKSVSLNYEPASEPLHISVKWLFLVRMVAPQDRDALGRERGGERERERRAREAIERHHVTSP